MAENEMKKENGWAQVFTVIGLVVFFLGVIIFCSIVVASMVTVPVFFVFLYSFVLVAFGYLFNEILRKVDSK